MFYLLHFFLFYCINYVGSINQLMSIIVYVLRNIFRHTVQSIDGSNVWNHHRMCLDIFTTCILYSTLSWII